MKNDDAKRRYAAGVGWLNISLTRRFIDDSLLVADWADRQHSQLRVLLLLTHRDQYYLWWHLEWADLINKSWNCIWCGGKRKINDEEELKLDGMLHCNVDAEVDLKYIKCIGNGRATVERLLFGDGSRCDFQDFIYELAKQALLLNSDCCVRLEYWSAKWTHVRQVLVTQIKITTAKRQYYSFDPGFGKILEDNVATPLFLLKNSWTEELKRPIGSKGLGHMCRQQRSFNGLWRFTSRSSAGVDYFDCLATEKTFQTSLDVTAHSYI